MNLLELGKTGPNDLGAARIAKRPTALKSYDSLAGSAMLRRAGKAGGSNPPLHGDPASKLLASRYKEVATDHLSRQLSDFYEAMLRQPVPERILALVEALDAQQSR
ncbi:NepR family anti-sigma factor [Methylocystis echinoides]|jgi:hypothetical protein|uniref:NepR family anti-sigma factor n=1 Tax=Methylocystis echinoides TaxID=29468 RepID=UPI00342015CE